MNKQPAVRRGWIVGALGACLCVQAMGQAGPAEARPDLAVVSSLPDSVDMVLAVRDLAALRDRPAGRALEAFLREVSDWGRSAAAWDELGRALGMTQDQTVDSLLGSGVVLAGAGMDPRHAGPAQFALLSTVAPQTEALLRTKLKPAPRGIAENTPVLSLERGAYQLAVSISRQARDPARATMLMAPSTSSDLFEELLPVLRGKAAERPLSAGAAWQRVRDLGPGDVLFLLRSPAALPAWESDGLFALTASQTDLGWAARFTASAPMLVGTVGAAGDEGLWPSAAVDALEEGSFLLVAGSARQQNGRALLGAEKPLLFELLEMMDLPRELRASLEGTAIIAVHAEGSPGSPDESMSVLVALPAPDMARFSERVEPWSMSRGVEGDDWRHAPITSRQGVRQVPMRRGTPALIPPALRSTGVMAWCYATEHGARPQAQPGALLGWCVISMRFGAGEAGQAAVVARRAAELLEADEGKDTATLFRLVVRPRELAALIRAPEEPSPAAPTRATPLAGTKDPLMAMRWLDHVDSWVRRTGQGQVEGTVSLKLNLGLLDAGK